MYLTSFPTNLYIYIIQCGVNYKVGLRYYCVSLYCKSHINHFNVLSSPPSVMIQKPTHPHTTAPPQTFKLWRKWLSNEHGIESFELHTFMTVLIYLYFTFHILLFALLPLYNMSHLLFLLIANFVENRILIQNETYAKQTEKQHFEAI